MPNYRVFSRCILQDGTTTVGPPLVGLVVRSALTRRTGSHACSGWLWMCVWGVDSNIRPFNSGTFSCITGRCVLCGQKNGSHTLASSARAQLLSLVSTLCVLRTYIGRQGTRSTYTPLCLAKAQPRNVFAQQRRQDQREPRPGKWTATDSFLEPTS